MAPGFWTEKGDLITKPHGLVAIKEQRANLQGDSTNGLRMGKERQATQDKCGKPLAMAAMKAPDHSQAFMHL